jgi:TIR domain-containing protein/pentapeptide repeat protein
MAVVDAIHVLRRGPKEWNEYRAASRAVPHLTHVEIRNAALGGADFHAVDFDGSTFINVDLRESNLEHARLNGLRMSMVRLDDASLRQAELKGTDLDLVSLRGANLDEVEAFELKIRRSNLVMVTWRRALMRTCHIYNSDLTGAKLDGWNVGSVVLKRPVADDSTLTHLEAAGCEIVFPNEPYRSDWIPWNEVSIPGHAARSAYLVHSGRTHWFTYNRSDFFVSHSSEDKETIARPLVTALRRRRQRVWYDEMEVKAGDSLDAVIRRGIGGANFGVVIVSPTFFGREWTEKELKSLTRKNVFVIRHGVSPDQLRKWRPALANRFTLSSDVGAATVARQLLEAVSRVPGKT